MSGRRGRILTALHLREKIKRVFASLPEFSKKGGNPAAGSPTATLLRLHPSHEAYLG